MGNLKQDPATVLLLETNPQVRATVASMLKDSGFVVGESYDFNATLEILQTVGFDLLLCCSAPRELSCDKLAVKAKGLQPNIKVIVATTQNEHPRLDHAKEVDLVLLKPFDLRVLTGFMNELLKVREE